MKKKDGEILNQVFAYGTLTSRFKDFDPAVFIGKYQVDHSDMYPRMVPDDEIQATRGHLIYLTDEEFEEADRYEGYPDLYTRVQKKVKLDDGLITTAWIYM